MSTYSKSTSSNTCLVHHTFMV